MVSVSLKEFRKIDARCRQDTHSQYTSVQYSLFTSAERLKSIPPNTENCMQDGYDENDDNNMSNETKRETNYSNEQQVE